MKIQTVICVLFLLVVCLSVSCKGPKAVTNTSVDEREKDSVYVREVPRLIPYQLPGAKVSVTRHIECDPITNKPVPVEGSESKGKETIHYAIDKDGHLTIQGECDSLKLMLEVKDKEITRLKETSRAEKTVETKIEHKAAWYDIAARCIAALFIILLIIRLKNTV